MLEHLLADDVPAGQTIVRRDQQSVALLALCPRLLGQRLQQLLHRHGAVNRPIYAMKLANFINTRLTYIAKLSDWNLINFSFVLLWLVLIVYNFIKYSSS